MPRIGKQEVDDMQFYGGGLATIIGVALFLSEGLSLGTLAALAIGAYLLQDVAIAILDGKLMRKRELKVNIEQKGKEAIRMN